jgi:hypothetical protein
MVTLLNSFVVLPGDRGVVPLSLLEEYAARNVKGELANTLRDLRTRGLIEIVWGAHESAVKLTAKGALRVAFLPPSQWLD